MSIKPRMEMNAETMHQCEKRERDRERKWRKAKKRAHLAGIVHYDFAAAEAAENSPACLSDNGAGVEAIVRQCDSESEIDIYEDAGFCHVFAKWWSSLFDERLPDAIDRIIRNRDNRKESICLIRDMIRMKKKRS